MPETTLILGRRVLGDGFAHAVADYVRREQEVLRETTGRTGATISAKSHDTALSVFASYLSTLTQDDQALRVLQLAQPSPRTYEPGPTQRRLLSHMGAFGHQTDPVLALAESAAVAVEDALDRERKRYATTLREREQERNQMRGFAALEQSAATAELEREDLRERLAIADAECGRLAKQADILRSLLPEDVAEKAAPRTNTGRRSVQDEPNVYERERKDGTKTYAVGWREDGAQQFSGSVESIEEARGIRDELVAAGKIKALVPA